MLQQVNKQTSHTGVSFTEEHTSEVTPSLAALEDSQALMRSGEEVNLVKTYLGNTPPCVDTLLQHNLGMRT